MNDPRNDFPFLNNAGSGWGCGCMLPSSGMVLLVLTIALGWTLRTHTEGWTPPWLLVIALAVAMVVLFVRIYSSRKRPPPGP